MLAHPTPVESGVREGAKSKSWFPGNLECLHFLILLSLHPNYSFMPMVPGLVFFMCDFLRGPQGGGDGGREERDSMLILETDVSLSLPLFLIGSLLLLICETCQCFLFPGPQFPWMYKEGCAK